MEARAVRPLVVGFFAVFFAVALLAAAPASLILGTPVLIVYPFSVNGGDVSKEAGSRLAVTIATQIANLGGVNVKPAPPGTDRQNYLDAAHTEGANYYIAGFVTPLGDGVSVVEQLVSSETGIVVYSNTAQVRTYADAAGQGDVLREALLRHYARNLGAYAAPPPPSATAPPAATSGSGKQANIGRLFGHKQRTAAPASSPTATAAAQAAQVARATSTPAPPPATTPPAALTASAPPSPTPEPAHSAAVAAAGRASGFGVLSIGGPAEDERRSFTGAAIRNDMIANHQRVADTGGTREAVCRQAEVGTLLGGNLSTRKHTILGQSQLTATLELLAYDCAGNVVYQRTFAHDARGGNWRDAVDGVVASAVTTFLHEPAGRRS